MNDFTKEELEEFLDAIGWKLGEGQADKLTLPLESKLKSMIDTYSQNEPIISKQNYELAMYIISQLMEDDPDPASSSGLVLNHLYSIAAKYEKATRQENL